MLFCQSAEHWLNILKKMKTLVIGGAGFIGSHLVEELVKLKFDVVVLDNLSTGNINNLKLVKKKISFIKQDIRINKNLKDVEQKISDWQYEIQKLNKTIQSSEFHISELTKRRINSEEDLLKIFLILLIKKN